MGRYRSVHACCQFLVINDLWLHELRHERINRRFGLGWDVPRVASVSGHPRRAVLQRDTHISRQELHDKYEDSRWHPTSPDLDKKSIMNRISTCFSLIAEYGESVVKLELSAKNTLSGRL